MKKLFSVLTTLAMVAALSVAITASAVDAQNVDEVQKDVQEVITLLSKDYSQEEIKAAVQDALSGLDLPSDPDEIDAANLPADAGAQVAAKISSNLKLDDAMGDIINGVMSNEAVSWLAGMYIDDKPTTTQAPKPVETTKTTTSVKTGPDLVQTGDSAVVAISTLAVLTVAGATAVVCLKKKEG